MSDAILETCWFYWQALMNCLLLQGTIDCNQGCITCGILGHQSPTHQSPQAHFMFEMKSTLQTSVWKSEEENATFVQGTCLEFIWQIWFEVHILRVPFSRLAGSLLVFHITVQQLIGDQKHTCIKFGPKRVYIQYFREGISIMIILSVFWLKLGIFIVFLEREILECRFSLKAWWQPLNCLEEPALFVPMHDEIYN